MATVAPQRKRATRVGSAHGSWVAQMGRATAGLVHGLWENHVASFSQGLGSVANQGQLRLLRLPLTLLR